MNHITFEALPRNISKQDIQNALWELGYNDTTVSFIF